MRKDGRSHDPEDYEHEKGCREIVEPGKAILFSDRFIQVLHFGNQLVGGKLVVLDLLLVLLILRLPSLLSGFRSG